MTQEEQSKQQILELVEHRENDSLLRRVNIVWGICLLIFLCIAGAIIYGTIFVITHVHMRRGGRVIGVVVTLVLLGAYQLMSYISTKRYKRLIVNRLVEAGIGMESFHSSTSPEALNTAVSQMDKSELFSEVEKEKATWGNAVNEVTSEDYFVGTVDGKQFQLCDMRIIRTYEDEEDKKEPLFQGLFMMVPVATDKVIVATSEPTMLRFAKAHFAKPVRAARHADLLEQIEKTVRWIGPQTDYLLFVRNRMAHVFVPQDSDMFDISLLAPANGKTIRRDFTSVIALRRVAELLTAERW